MKILRALFVVALALAFVVPAYAETQNVKVSGSLDAYWLYRSNFDLQDGNDIGSATTTTASYTHGTSGDPNQKSDADDYFMSITQVQVAADLTDNVSTVINLVNQRDWNAREFVAAANGASVASETAANEFDIILDLAYVQMKEIFYSPLTLTIGRQDLLFGRGFIVGWNPQDPQGTTQADEFTQIQSFDAIRATLDFNPWTLDFVYSKIDENSNNPEDDIDLYIANVNYKFAEYNAVAEGYYVGHYDRGTLSSAPASQESNKTHTVGGRVQFDPISQITLGAELAYQFGGYRSSATATERDREAWGVDIFGTYRWDYTWKPEVTVEYVLMSGEADLSSTSTADYGSWNAPFRGPTYGWIHEYLETYYGTAAGYDQGAGQNLQFISVGGSLKPLDDLSLGAVFYYYWADEDMHTTPADPATAVRDDEIGWEVDTTVTYAYTEDVTFQFMANWFVPGGLYTDPEDDTASEYISRVLVTF